MASKDFAGELIKTIEEIKALHGHGALRVPELDARIDFLFGTPYHAIAKDAEGMDALEAVIAAILHGTAFIWDPEAPVDRDKTTLTLSSQRLIQRIKNLGEPEKPAKTKSPTKAAPKPVPPALDLALVSDKLPILPEGGEFPHDQNSIPAILFHLKSGIIDALSPALRALVIVVDGRLIDAVAVVQDQFLQGPSALDAITLDTAKALNVRTLDAPIASVIPFFWQLPVRVRDLQARWLGGTLAVQSFIKPDAWGVIQVRTDGDTALIFFSQGKILLSYSQQHPAVGTDLSALTSLFNDDSAIITARVEDEIGAPVVAAIEPAPIEVTPPPATPEPVVILVPPTPESPVEVAPAPVVLAPIEPPIPIPPRVPTPPVIAPAPVVEPPIAAPAPPVVVAPVATPTPPIAPPPAPAPVPQPPALAPAAPAREGSPSTAPPPSVEAGSVTPPWAVPSNEPVLEASVLDRILSMIRTEMQIHSPAIEAEFIAAERTRSGFLKAAKRVRAMRPRLISEERMESIGTRAINIITGREAA